MFKLLILLVLVMALAWLLRRPRRPRRRLTHDPTQRSTNREADGEADAPYASDAADASEVVEIPLTDELDLHTIQPREMADAVDAYIDAACERGFTRVRIIHGRGIGVARDIVRQRLQRHPRVRSFADAPPPSHWGATIVELHERDVAPDRTTD